MKKTCFLAIMAIALLFAQSCTKDGNGVKLNTLEIKSGEFSGYSHYFNPNMGFWSTVDETTRLVQLVLGDDKFHSEGGEDVMVIVFYNTGFGQVQFPSPEGQWIRFGLNINGVVYNFREDNAELSITQVDDMHFEGTLTGQFIDVADNSRKINFTIALSVPLQEY